MNKIIILLIVAVVVVGGGYWYYTSTGAGDDMMAGENDSMMGDAQMAGGMTLAAIMAGGQNVQCDYVHDSGNNQSSGHVYIANGGDRFRGDFTITAPQAMEAHVIRDGGYNYVWGSMMMGQGVKTQVTAENRNKLFSSDDASVPEDVTYHCEPWSVNASVFTLPSGVEFMDIGAQMNVEMQGSAGMKAAQCASCAQLEGDARAQCEMALGCN